jgi:segregation and condensation protein A
MPFAVKNAEFSGPLELLLELIEQKDLEIAKVSLAKVADDFLLYIQEKHVRADGLADFLLVASRLIYLKSRELLPFLRLVDEDIASDVLAEQLRIYREFVSAAERLEARYGQHLLFERPSVKSPSSYGGARGGFNFGGRPPTASELAEAYREVQQRLEPFFALTAASLERVKSVEERIDELREAIALNASLSFKQVTAGAAKKIDVVMSFLALLELLRRNIIRTTQHNTWGDIMIHRID